MKLVPGGTVAEARQALNSLQAILEAAGSSMSNIVKTNILVNNIEEFGAVNEVYKECKTNSLLYIYYTLLNSLSVYAYIIFVA